MTRHITDHPRDRGDARLREYLRAERESGRHPAVIALHTRPQTRDDGRKTAQYLRIERGK
ncbi:hypothetical protein [Paracoccus sp. (in: a-proteobacteria)]|uniref:hypothetical protein n=1 Tax=Paracoccus sp. TaxID=267 RepID=UPI0026DF498F|nr:hypothetical protein [Paracoccus sp. (in: a-proteobacteria)]MDO5647010.1 hypothetical protein [Paracoccus sp. (in: a-proteobacteria)]